MIEFLEEIDRSIVLAVNSWNTPILDEIMWWISARITWVPLYIFLLYLAFRFFDKITFIKFIFFVVAAVVISDLVSVHLFKNLFLRYRPSHHVHLMKQLHFYQIKPGEYYRGGTYGFVSSHAANFFTVMTAVLLAFKGHYSFLKWLLPLIGILICFSRIYLGVHYMSDIIAGAAVGAAIAWVLYRFWFRTVFKSEELC
ncbi:MAG: phosphatase PAP2 family protein [Flavobacteriales bacterium]